MMRSFLGFFGYKPQSQDDLKEPLVELHSIEEPAQQSLRKLEEKLVVIKERSDHYLKSKNPIIITVDAMLSTLSGGAAVGSYFLVAGKPTSASLLNCLHNLTATLSDYCQNVDSLQTKCDGDNCQDTAKYYVPVLTFMICSMGILVAHDLLKSAYKDKRDALDQQQRNDTLTPGEKALLEHFEITGNSTTILARINGIRKEILVYLQEHSLEERAALTV